MSMKILVRLDNPADLVRVNLIGSNSWLQFVIANGLCKQVGLKLLPGTYGVAYTTELNYIDPVKLQNDRLELESLRRKHRVYAFLARGLNPFTSKDCISEAISASSAESS